MGEATGGAPEGYEGCEAGTAEATLNWQRIVLPDAEVFIKVFRFAGRDHARAVVAVTMPPPGYKAVHLTRPVAVAGNRRLPAWLFRSVAAVVGELRGGACTLSALATVAEAAHAGPGIRKCLEVP